jgi:hypothetical protein
MSWPINPQIRRWLDSGNATEALLGRGDYFIRDHHWIDEHARILVASQLLQWAFPDHVEEAAMAVHRAVSALLDDNALSEAVDLIWSYVLVAEDRHVRLPVDLALLDGALDRAGMAHIPDAPEDRVFTVKQRLDALAGSAVDEPHVTLRDAD